MRARWLSLKQSEQTVFRVTMAFLDGRLEQRDTLDWALRLTASDTAKRAAVLELLDRLQGPKISEPWLSGWRFIEESWNSPPAPTRVSGNGFLIKQRLRSGDKSQSLIQDVLDHVAPRLRVEPFSRLHLTYAKPAARPKTVEDLFSAKLESGDLLDPNEIGLANCNDVNFLMSLGRALDACVLNGVEIAYRLGWHLEQGFWRLGGLNRVEYVSEPNRRDEEHEPDEFHTGIAPAVKLLHAAVTRIAEIDISRATEFVRKWQLTSTPLHLRLWAALSTNPRITEANVVASALLSMNDRQFWNLHDYPEIAELRAARFSEFDKHSQIAILKRLRKKPPRKQWGKDVYDERVTAGQRYWAARELRRIEAAGSVLPAHYKAWLEDTAKEFSDLAASMRGDEGFLGMPKARFVAPNPDAKYDELHGEDRLRALENALGSPRKAWDNDPSQRAADWIRQGGNTAKIISDFETTTDGGSQYSRVWETFGWFDSSQAENNTTRMQHASRVAALLESLQSETISKAIEGISHWLSSWGKIFGTAATVFNIWAKIWPIAVDATNAASTSDDEIDLNIVAKSTADREPDDLDTLNTPTGKLVGVFLSMCPEIKSGDRPFETDLTLRHMRESLIQATGRSRLIAQHRLIEALPYFLLADAPWTIEQLIKPLRSDSTQTLALWRAIGRRTQFREVLSIIGNEMAERANDRRVGRDTRRSLVFSLVVESLYALRENREPAVPYALIQQTLRTVEDEVRAHAAGAVQRFIEDVGTQVDRLHPLSREGVFASAVAPFMKRVWPQERSLSAPSVSNALARMPVVAREAFVKAVDAVEPFLVPFDCWSMIDYGLFGEDGGKSRLSLIDSPEKAEALLRLLNATIGTAEGAIVPHDLPDALSQIRTVAPRLAQAQAYIRLATAARRI